MVSIKPIVEAFQVAKNRVAFRWPLSQRMAPPSGPSKLKHLLKENALRGRDILSINDLSSEEIGHVLEIAALLKMNKFDETQTLLAKGQTLAMLFEKPSLRTRVTFEAGMTQLGGHAIYLEGKLGEREPVVDVAKNLERWCDGIMARTFKHSTIEELADNANIPVINGLSDLEHPCQALADFLTLLESKGYVDGLKLAFIGDGNNVANSLALCAAKLGVDFSIACPPGYEPDAVVWSKAQELAAMAGVSMTLTHDPLEAIADADAVYTDSWVSMGQEAETEQRMLAFKEFQVDKTLMQHAKPDSIFMHCLPAHRGLEVSSEVIDGAASAVYREAENRLHVQKALLSVIL